MKNLNDGYAKIITDETLRETISHGSEEYPFRYYYEDIWLLDLHCIDWHWHPEVEFVLVENGTADFFVGSSRYVLNTGEAIFINTQVIHRFESSESTIIPNMVFSPLLIAAENSLIYRKYIKPVLMSSVECLIISPTDEKQCEMLDTVRNVNNRTYYEAMWADLRKHKLERHSKHKQNLRTGTSTAADNDAAYPQKLLSSDNLGRHCKICFYKQKQCAEYF